MIINKAKKNLSIEDLKKKISDAGGLYEVIWSNDIQQKIKEYGIGFDCENFTDDDEQFITPGFTAGYDILTGIPVRWIAAGGDWEKPVCFCIYIDSDDKLTAYVPKDGNVYDKEKSMAYGNYECKEVYEAENEKYDSIQMNNSFCNDVKIEN